MHKSHYQPKRSQQLFLVQELREKYYELADQEVVVHHVLEDTPTRLYLQIERRESSAFGFAKIYFERVEL